MIVLLPLFLLPFTLICVAQLLALVITTMVTSVKCSNTFEGVIILFVDFNHLPLELITTN